MDDLLRNIIYTCPVDHAGTSVYVKGWLKQPKNSPRSVVLLHDLGENSNVFEEIAPLFVKEGFNVYSFDMRNCGVSRRSEQTLSFKQLVLDLLQVAAWIKREQNGSAPYFIGQGFGALLALSCVRLYPHFCQGLVLASPLMHLASPLNSFLRFLIKSFSEISPNLLLPKSLTWHFTAPYIKQKNTSRISVQLAFDLLEATRQSGNELSLICVPTLFMASEKSDFCNISKCQSLLQNSKNFSQFSFFQYEDHVHRILSEGQNSKKWLVPILEWLESFVSPEACEDRPLVHKELARVEIANSPQPSGE